MPENAAHESGEQQQDAILIDPKEVDETVESECPACGLTGEVPSQWVGLTIECKECGKRFDVTEDGG